MEIILIEDRFYKGRYFAKFEANNRTFKTDNVDTPENWVKLGFKIKKITQNNHTVIL